MPTLQEQINIASAGATIQHDTEFVGNLVIDKPLTIEGSGIISSPIADPAVFIPPKTGPVVLKGKSVNEPLRVTHTTKIFDLIRWGEWQTSSLSDVPQGLTLEYVDAFGAPGVESQRGLAANGANLLVKNSKIRDIKGKGYDTQAVCGWNGPGPFKFIDSFFEASGENILFGGADARIQNLVPSDIEIRRCHLFKPLTWRGVWSVKNLFELKNARRVVMDGCKLENCWGDAQIGFGVLFTVRSQDGTNPWAVVEDVEFTNNEMLNMAGGFQLIGKDSPNESQQSSRLRIANSIIRLAQNGELGPNGRLLQIQQFNEVTVENIDANPGHTFMNLTGSDADGNPITISGLVYRNNVVSYGQYGLFTDADRPYTTFAPDGVVTGNYIYGPGIPESKKIAGNSYFDTRPTSIPEGVGVDMEALRAAQAGATPTPTPTPDPAPSPTPPTTPTRKVGWPSGEGKQNLILDEQWKERYRMKRHLRGAYAEFEKAD